VFFFFPPPLLLNYLKYHEDWGFFFFFLFAAGGLTSCFPNRGALSSLFSFYYPPPFCFYLPFLFLFPTFLITKRPLLQPLNGFSPNFIVDLRILFRSDSFFLPPQHHERHVPPQRFSPIWCRTFSPRSF